MLQVEEKKGCFLKSLPWQAADNFANLLVSNASFSSSSRHKLTHALHVLVCDEMFVALQFTPPTEVKIFEGDEKMITVKEKKKD